jgi:ArsR family transcriptional regulator
MITTAAKEFDLERFFVALSDPTRLRLLNLMGEDEICVCFFVEVLEEPQPKISRHLAYLRRAGIVAARREHKWMHYRIVPPPHPHAARILSEVLEWFKVDKEKQRERSRLITMCCSAALPVQLLGAPKPASLTVALSCSD